MSTFPWIIPAVESAEEKQENGNARIAQDEVGSHVLYLTHRLNVNLIV
jgi:hypothetical protein